MDEGHEGPLWKVHVLMHDKDGKSMVDGVMVEGDHGGR